MLEHILALMSPSDMRASVGGAILEALIRQYGAGGKYTQARRVFDQIQGPTDAFCLRAIDLSLHVATTRMFCSRGNGVSIWIL